MTPKATFKLYHSVDAALKKQLLDATNETYLTSLKNRNTGFAMISTRLIEHLYVNYGRINVNMLTENEEKMKKTVGRYNAHRTSFRPN